MKRVRRFLYLIVMAVVVAAIAVFTSACGDSDETPATEYTLTFMNGTAPYYTITGTAGSDVVFEKEEPARINLVFDGWSETDGGEVVELPAKMPAENRTYYAVFSVRYTITFNAGSGTLSDDSKTLKVRAGNNLYDLVSGVVPTATGDSMFAAWYYNGSELSASSETVMPATNITVEAKYSVNYVLKEYTQNGYGNDDEVTYAEPVTKNQVGFVGDIATVANYAKYVIDENKDDKVTTTVLSANSAENVYNVYYNYKKLTVVFNYNLPNVENVSGKMDDLTVDYGVEEDVPECDYRAAGYRFVGWSETANGKVDYVVGDKFAVQSTTTLYAVWDKGYVDANGASTDYIFIHDDDGEKTVYLRRAFYDDIVGEYNANSHEFSFKNSGVVFLRGIVNLDAETYLYLENQASTTYSFNNRKTELYNGSYVILNNEISATSTLVVKENGDLVYTDADDNVKNGTLSYDEEADSMVFIGDNDFSFHFRLTLREGDDGYVPVFEIRDDEMYGLRYKYTASGIDATSYMFFDGYGSVVFYTYGHTSTAMSSSNLTAVTIGGYYLKLDNEDEEDRADVCVSLYNNNNYVRTNYISLIKSQVYNVYAVREYAMELYAKPADTSAEDFDWDTYKATASKIVLDGYGVYNDSAVYTFTDSQGQSQTVTGRYILDLYMNELTIVTTGGNYLIYISVETIGDEDVLVFKNTDGSYDTRYVLGLGDANVYYQLRLIDDTNADFSFRLPVADNFLGVYEYNPRFTVMFSGTYQEVGKDADDNAIYEFTADESFYEELTNGATVADYTFIRFYYAYGVQLNMDNFAKFTFYKSTAYYQNQQIPCFAVSELYDGLGGTKITLDEIEYTLDGYGNAVSEAADAKTISYTVSTSNGIESLILKWNETVDGKATEKHETFVRVEEGGPTSFTRVTAVYQTNNAQYSFIVSLLDGNNYALIGYIRYTTSGAYYTYYSVGTVSKDSDDIYSYTETFCKTEGVQLLSIYGDLKFSVVSEPEDGKNGRINVEKGIGASVTVVGVGTLTINNADGKAEATFTDADNKTYSGSYTIYENVLVISYEVTENENKTTVDKKFKLVYGTGVQANEVVSFSEVGDEIGTWWNINGDGSTMFLSAEGYVSRELIVGKDDEGNDVKKNYDFADAVYTVGEKVINGVYYRTDNQDLQEYCFIYTEDSEEKSFMFWAAYDNAMYLPVFMIKTGFEIREYVYASPTAANYAAALIGNGYNSYLIMLSTFQSVSGTISYDEEHNIVMFTANGSTMYFGYVPVKVNGQLQTRLVALDNTVVAPNFGVFAVDGGSVVIGGYTVTEVQFTGYGFAILKTEDDNDDDLRVYYDIPSQGDCVLYVVNDENKDVIIAIFDLLVRNNTDYVISFADTALNYRFAGIFKGDNYTSLFFDGFNSGIYIDAQGIQRSVVVYAKVENTVDDAIIVEMIYVGNMGYEYMVVAIEDGEFTVIDEDDPRYPQEEEEESTSEGVLAE